MAVPLKEKGSHTLNNGFHFWRSAPPLTERYEARKELVTGRGSLAHCTGRHPLTQLTNTDSTVIQQHRGLLKAIAPSTAHEPLDRPIPTSHDSRALALELYDSSRARLWGMFFVASSAHRDPDSSRRHRHGLDGAYVFSLAGMTMMPSDMSKGGWLTRVIL